MTRQIDFLRAVNRNDLFRRFGGGVECIGGFPFVIELAAQETIRPTLL